MNRSYQLGLVATALCAVVAAFFLMPIFGRPAARSFQTKNLSNAKQLAIGCKIYASEHEGRFPMHLSELEPDYMPKGAYDELRFSSVGRENDPKYLMDWLYFGAGFTEQNPPRLLIASPQATTTLPKSKRAIIEGDTSGRVINEVDFHPLLAETVRQMRAEGENRRTKSSPEQSTGLGAEKASAH